VATALGEQAAAWYWAPRTGEPGSNGTRHGLPHGLEKRPFKLYCNILGVPWEEGLSREGVLSPRMSLNLILLLCSCPFAAATNCSANDTARIEGLLVQGQALLETEWNSSFPPQFDPYRAVNSTDYNFKSGPLKTLCSSTCGVQLASCHAMELHLGSSLVSRAAMTVRIVFILGWSIMDCIGAHQIMWTSLACMILPSSR
jgi:hypothetical protein